MDKIITREYGTHSEEIFSQCKPMLVGAGGLMLFPGTPLLEELKLLVEDLTCDRAFITYHTVAANLTGSYFLSRKDRIVATLDHAIQHAMRARMGVRYPGEGE